MRIWIFFVLFCLGINLNAQVFEAEQGELVGTQVESQRTGYTGTGYVTGFDEDNDKVTITADVNATGIYELYIRYAGPYGEKFNYIFVNDVSLGNIHFPEIMSFTEISVGRMFLEKGKSRISIVKEWGYFEVDNLRLTPAQRSPINPVAESLVTPGASSEASSLYAFIKQCYGKVVLSGQYGGATELNRIKTVSGKLPLVRGFDLMDYSPSRVQFGAQSDETEKAIEWHEQRGIVTMSWHWNAPKDLIDEPGKEWWRGFYTYATTFDVSKAMNNNNSEEYNLIIQDIDAIAEQLKILQNEGVPILWRPLHEAEGAWFWWGAKGPETCKWLWKLLFTRLVDHHKINNLIWVWTSSATSAAPDWYPGDDFVDVIGADIYVPAGMYGSNFMMFDNLARIFQGRKIITLSENGPIPDPDKLFREESAWSWFCTWSGEYIMDGKLNTQAHISKVFNHEYVITLDELDDVNNIIAELDKKRNESEDGEVIVSVEEYDKDVFSYTNPIANGFLQISTTNGKRVSKVELVDANGKMISWPANSEVIEIDFSMRAAGAYVLRLHLGKSVKIVRVIKL